MREEEKGRETKRKEERERVCEREREKERAREVPDLESRVWGLGFGGSGVGCRV